MIQFRRGKTENWFASGTAKLAAGQPGYDKDKNKLKIGDGKSSWSELPSASGLSADEILAPDDTAFKNRNSLKELIKNLIKGDILAILKKESPAIITYGTKDPSECGEDPITKKCSGPTGQIYLQYYDAEPEVDYVVESGINNGWAYQKWSSGIAKCSTVIKFSTSIQTELATALYRNSNEFVRKSYPFKFKNTEEFPAPAEFATIQSPGGLVWLATAKEGTNTLEKSAVYNIISPSKQSNTAEYRISLHVEGFWR